jgi:hypothetical protein
LLLVFCSPSLPWYLIPLTEDLEGFDRLGMLHRHSFSSVSGSDTIASIGWKGKVSMISMVTRQAWHISISIEDMKFLKAVDAGTC